MMQNAVRLRFILAHQAQVTWSNQTASYSKVFDLRWPLNKIARAKLRVADVGQSQTGPIKTSEVVKSSSSHINIEDS
jgi:hypothetical protein